VVALLVYFHHEDCSLAVDVCRPFSEVDNVSDQTSITRLSFLRPLPLLDVRALLNALEMRRGCCISANFVDPQARFAIDFGESNYRSVLMMPGGHDLV